MASTSSISDNTPPSSPATGSDGPDASSANDVDVLDIPYATPRHERDDPLDPDALTQLERFAYEPTTSERLLGASGPSANDAAGPAYCVAPTDIDRSQQIDTWVADHVDATTSFAGITLDTNGGEHVAAALDGQSSLGPLSVDEQRQVIEQAVDAWLASGNREALREAADVQDPVAREVVAAVYAEQVATSLLSVPASAAEATLSRAQREMLAEAIRLDPVAVVERFAGIEGHLGRLAGDADVITQMSLLDAVASGAIDPASEGVSVMVTAMFLKADTTVLALSELYRASMAGALGQIMADRSDPADPALAGRIVELQARYQSILSTDGGFRLLANPDIAPELRGWALAEIAANPAWNAESLADGWESDIVSAAYATPIVAQYQARGTDTQTLGREALRNIVGQALNIPPDRLPPANESAIDEAARLAEGLNHAYYGPNARIDTLVDTMMRVGGDQVTFTLLPVTVTSNEFGAATFNVFRVEGSDGNTYLIEDVAPERAYPSLDAWLSDSRLPPGQMSYVASMHWRDAGTPATIVTAASPAVVDSFGEWARAIGDGAALGIGIVAGIAIIAGTGGTALLVVAGGAGIYTTARAGEELAEDYRYGVDITNLSNAEIRAHWFDVAAGTLSFGAIGAAKLATLARGTRAASGLSGTAAGLQIAANTADAAAMSNQAIELAARWSDLSAAERAAGLLNIAFWGGMTAASTRAGGGTLADATSFARLKNNIEFGVPYPVSRNADLAAGEMHIRYEIIETGSGPRATGIHIEYGGVSADPAQLALHGRVARQMEASGGFLDRLSVRFGGEAGPPAGSAAWEAQFELQKIHAETLEIATALQGSDLPVVERARLENRLAELETALDGELARWSALSELGDGVVASPSRGAVQAESLGWPEAPTGYTWVAGVTEPHLRRLDADGERLYYDAANAQFVESAQAPAMQRVGHGDNEVEWVQDELGRTIEVTAVLREYHTHVGRSADELAAQEAIRASGLDTDHAGHIVAHRFVLDQGIRNLIPQDANLNTSAYKTMENELADWIAAGGEVQLNVRLHDYQNGRPDAVEVRYSIVHPSTGETVYRRSFTFDNVADQVFQRVGIDDIRSHLN